jgi:hypothetical protein
MQRLKQSLTKFFPVISPIISSEVTVLLIIQQEPFLIRKKYTGSDLSLILSVYAFLPYMVET